MVTVSGNYSNMFRRLSAGFSLAALAVLLLVGAAALSRLDQWRVDLTEGNLYSLSDSSKAIVANVHDPVVLKLYYSEALSRPAPALRNYAKRVEEMLQEFERAGNGKLDLQVIYPELYSEDEDAAAAAGLLGIPNGQGEKFYLGLVATRGEKTEIINFFSPEKESSLEYQISQLIYRMSRPAPVTVGVISGLPVFRSMDRKTHMARPPWLIVDQLQQMFDIRRQLDTSVDKIDDDLNLLIVIHPNMLPEKTLFAIDQFVLRGGKLLVFVDPVAEADESESTMGAGFTDRSSSLEQLFTAWGIDYDPKKVVLDLGYAHSIPVTQDGQEAPHVGILGLDGNAINREQNVIAELENINVASAGALSQRAGASTQFVPLLTSSDQTQLMNTDEYVTTGRHDELLRKMKPGNQRYYFAALVSGAVKTAFPEGKPATSQFTGDIRTESQQPVQVIAVADTDVLTDRMWVDRQDFYGQVMATPFAANGDMLVNMVDSLAGSADLISLRSRGTYQRPFTRVDELEKSASSRLREQEDALMQSLAATEKKINAMSAPVKEGEAAVAQELSVAQKAEIAQFQQEKLRIRKSLREVQRQLNSDVERLGMTLKLINIAAVPALLTMLALIFALVRWRKQR